VDWDKTRAYSIGLDGIYINRQGRERKGIIDDAQFEPTKRAIAEGLAALNDNGNPTVRTVYDVKEDFTGPYREQGPDLIIGFHEGFRVSWDCAKGTIAGHVFEDNTKSWSGDHCIDPPIVPGILYSNLKLSEENPRLMDIGPTVLDLFGVNIPGYMTGKNVV
jgi:predicted AlkP superfamily phosphohydrolase/phosphomutase